jgi:hypothetical protein
LNPVSEYPQEERNDMSPHTNPICEKGEKNVFCPYYGDCLNLASKQYWHYWSCRKCGYIHEAQPIPIIMYPPHNADPHYALSPVLYQKDREFKL